MDSDGNNQKRLTDNNAYEDSPSWSPEGYRIVFTSMRDGKPSIYIMDFDGKNQKRITDSYPLQKTELLKLNKKLPALKVLQEFGLHQILRQNF